MGELRLPVTPEHVTVLGHRVWAGHPRWLGLDWTGAEIRDKASILVAAYGYDDAPADLHFDVPFRYPGAPATEYEGVKYRVRPRYEPGRRCRINGRMVHVRGVRLELNPPTIVVEV